MRLTPLGDQAVLAYLPDEAAAVAFADAVRSAAPPWLQDVVPAYASVGVFFDADLIGLGEVTAWLGARRFWEGEAPAEPGRSEARREPRPPKRHRIPVCSELQPDMARVSAHT